MIRENVRGADTLGSGRETVTVKSAERPYRSRSSVPIVEERSLVEVQAHIALTAGAG